MTSLLGDGFKGCSVPLRSQVSWDLIAGPFEGDCGRLLCLHLRRLPECFLPCQLPPGWARHHWFLLVRPELPAFEAPELEPSMPFLLRIELWQKGRDANETRTTYCSSLCTDWSSDYVENVFSGAGAVVQWVNKSLTSTGMLWYVHPNSHAPTQNKETDKQM